MKLRPTSTKTLNEIIEHLAIDTLRPFEHNARVHPAKKIKQLAAAIERLKAFVPIVIDEDDVILGGHARWAAARLLGMTSVPCIRWSHMTHAEKLAFTVADNRLTELSRWDEAALGEVLRILDGYKIDFDVEITGFDGAPLARLLDLDIAPGADPKADQIPEATGPAVTGLGDLWIMGAHRLICGDARDLGAYQWLMEGRRARMSISDAPYNVEIDGHAGGKGRVARRPFVMGAGEMSRPEFAAFLKDFMARLAEVGLDGSIHYIFMDWRHLADLLVAGEAVFDELKNLLVWSKENAGLGAFYRSQHELIAVFKKGKAPHLNTFGLGEQGRYRTNVWSYPGLNSFGGGRDEALALHPTVKPVAMIADAIRDVSRRGDIVLDAFGGSGTTLIAAEKTKRHARLIELDPLYCDTICRRWQGFTGQPAVLEGHGGSFEAIAAERRANGEGAAHDQA